MRSYIIKASFAYFVIVIAAGFGLGAIRTLGIAPVIGDTAAVLLELPVILAISWMAAGWAIERQQGNWDLAAGMRMGVLAFVLLQLAEAALATVVFGSRPGAYFAHWLTPDGAIGLAGQLLYGVFPAIRAARIHLT